MTPRSCKCTNLNLFNGYLVRLIQCHVIGGWRGFYVKHCIHYLKLCNGEFTLFFLVLLWALQDQAPSAHTKLQHVTHPQPVVSLGKTFVLVMVTS